jgi:hypothetical protein
VSKLACALVASALALAGLALVTGCGGSSGNNASDASTDTNKEHDAQNDSPGRTDSGKDSGPPKEGGTTDACVTFPAFVDNLITTETNSTGAPVAIPTCGEWAGLTPTGTAKASTTDPQTAAEFTPLPTP